MKNVDQESRDLKAKLNASTDIEETKRMTIKLMRLTDHMQQLSMTIEEEANREKLMKNKGRKVYHND